MYESLLAEGILAGLMGYLASAWYFLLVLIGFALIIFVHEFGHFIAAKFVGIKVETFAIGFGPRLFGIKYGATDYCVRAVPLGGYVKMLGQEDFSVDQDKVEKTKIDPQSFLAKTPGQRMLVVSGGVVMNIIFAAIAFIVVFMYGMDFPSAIAGAVVPGSPAAKAGIEPGDKFVSINGHRVLHFSEVMLAVALSDPGKPLDFELKRDGKIIHKTVEPVYNPEAELRQVGISGAGSLTVWDPGSGSELKEGDVIIRAGNIVPKQFYDVQKTIIDAKGKPVKLVVKRKIDDKEQTLTITKRAYLLVIPEGTKFAAEKPEKDVPKKELSILGLVPRRKFLYDLEAKEGSKRDTPYAHGGDVILRVGNILNPTGLQIENYFDQYRGKEVRIEVLRGKDRKEIAIPIPKKNFEFTFLISQMVFDEDNLIVASSIKGLKIPRGAKIVSCDNQSLSSWFDLVSYFESHKGKKVKIHYEYGGKKHSSVLNIPDNNWTDNISFGVDFFTRPQMTRLVGKYPNQAIALGLRQTWHIVKMAYVTIDRLAFAQSIGVKQLSGPIFIIAKGKEVAEAGLNKLLYYLALISANLAVINFLPIPIVDGGLMILLILEKIRGKALSPKITAIWQTVGISAIIALFAFVTYNDIAKLITGN